MESTEELINTVKTYLNSHYMQAYETWIEGCVDHFKETVNTVEAIQKCAYEQWLLNDLQDVCPGSLPPNFGALHKTVLNGRHVLQINKAIDISVPAYQQYLKLKNADTEYIKATTTPEEKISSNRMLKFELTDGNQTISGIEYETISKLARDLKPGCKILITGPVQCRQGMLLLTNNAVEYLDGEVSDLLQSCSLAAQLSAKLGLSIPEGKYIQDIHTMEVTQTANGISGSSSSDNSRNTDLSTVTKPEHINANSVILSTESINQTPVSGGRTPESQVTNTNPTNENPVANEEDIYHDYDFNDIPVDGFGKRELGDEDRVESSVKRVRIDANPASEYPDYIEEHDFFEDEEHWRDVENQFEQAYQTTTREGPTQVASEPFVYIKQINEMSDSAKSGKVFKVKAQILAFRTKLMMTNEWNLKCTLTDGTGCMDVEFASDILSKFLGFTPESISELKKNIVANPTIKEQVNLAFKKTNQNLETLYCIMELTMFALPKITRIIEFDQSHIDLLKRRLDTIGH